MDIPQELLEQIGKGNVVLFCGAGISISKNGIPSGNQLARELAQRASLGDVGTMSLPEVAQSYELEMGAQSLIAYITERVDDPSYSPLRTHRLIAALPFKRIITTNWDNLLEEALRQARKPVVKVVMDKSISYADNEKVLLIKLHGSAEQQDTIVVTGDDYYDVFARLPQVANLVKSYFATETLLFLGYGLADEDFKLLYAEVERHLGKHKRRAYAVQLSPTPPMVKYWEQKNVQVIAADVTTFLDDLATKTSTQSSLPASGISQTRLPSRTIADDTSTASSPTPREHSFTTFALANIDLRREVAEITICKSAPHVIYAVIDSTIFVSKDGARTWRATTGGTGLIAVDPNDPAIIYSLRTNGLFVSQDFGETWSLRSGTIRYKSFVGGQLVVHPMEHTSLLYADGGGVYVSRDQGREWRNILPQMPLAATTHWHYAINRKHPGELVAVGYERGIYFTHDWGATLQEVAAPPTGDLTHHGLMHPLAIDPQRAAIWYADLGSSKMPKSGPRGVFVTLNKGTSWQLVSSVDDPNGWLADYIEIVENAGISTICTTMPGGKPYYSVDSGDSWSQIRLDWRGLPDSFDQATRNSLTLAPVDALTNDGLIYLKTTCGLLKSTDNGRNWYY